MSAIFKHSRKGSLFNIDSTLNKDSKAIFPNFFHQKRICVLIQEIRNCESSSSHRNTIFCSAPGTIAARSIFSFSSLNSDKLFSRMVNYHIQRGNYFCVRIAKGFRREDILRTKFSKFSVKFHRMNQKRFSKKSRSAITSTTSKVMINMAKSIRVVNRMTSLSSAIMEYNNCRSFCFFHKVTSHKTLTFIAIISTNYDFYIFHYHKHSSSQYSSTNVSLS